MANSLGLDLTGKRVVMQGYAPEAARTFKVTGGFGAVPFTSGTALFVELPNGETCRMNGYDVEKLADEQK